ncbi:creatininase [Ornithinicoccus hortensis]|uniref:Creatinine amidohydrolase n=1 Tax=Ornithinicoccus hortensis TaxID=82346 RepID=A0A542YLX0_9MICO|nr:creatininase [Ornithinicoccus hortensis]TQL49073.1 creatinine amidohydrolase [Ornithinicoccus hortensis]
MTQDTTVCLAELDAHTYAEWLGSGSRTVVVPVGALEQHGPHLPMGTDAILSTAIAEQVATLVGAKVAQPISYGYKSQQKSGGGDHLVGTTSLDAATLVGLTRCLVSSLLEQGVRHVVFLNGHYENYQFLYEGVDLAVRDAGLGAEDEACVLLLSYWDYVSQETLDEVYQGSFPGWDVEHGGVLETALMLHLRPESVWLDRAVDHPPAELPRFDRLPVQPGRTPASGCLSAPRGANAAQGKLLFDQVTADLAADLTAELGSAQAD